MHAHLQVLLLDADSMPLVDPQLLFKVPLFQCVLLVGLFSAAALWDGTTRVGRLVPAALVPPAVMPTVRQGHA